MAGAMYNLPERDRVGWQQERQCACDQKQSQRGWFAGAHKVWASAFIGLQDMKFDAILVRSIII